jgi:hypothetical protein
LTGVHAQGMLARMRDRDLLGPPTTKWPWPPPLSLMVLFELRVALLELTNEEVNGLVPPDEREAFERAPIEWCLEHRNQGYPLIKLASDLMRGFEYFRKFGPET